MPMSRYVQKLVPCAFVAQEGSNRPARDIDVLEMPRNYRAERSRHVGGHLGRAEGPIIDPYFIDHSYKVLTEKRIPSDSKRMRRNCDGKGLPPCHYIAK